MNISRYNRFEVDIPDNIMAEDEESSIIATAVVERTTLPKRTKKYIIKALRPNIYLGMYYSELYKEYKPPKLLNILPKKKTYK